MPEPKEYRAYTLHRDGHIVDRFDLTATEEPEAIDQAQRLVDGHDVELWLGSRKIATLSHKQALSGDLSHAPKQALG